MNRRHFLSGLIAITAAPAIVRSESLMRIWVPPQEIVPAYNYEAYSAAARMAKLRGQILMNTIPFEVMQDIHMNGVGVVGYTNGTIKYRRVSPFELFREANNA